MKTDTDDEGIVDFYVNMLSPEKEAETADDFRIGDPEVDKMLEEAFRARAERQAAAGVKPPPTAPVRTMSKIEVYIYVALAVLIALFVMPHFYIVPL